MLFLRCRAAPPADEHARLLVDAIDPAGLFAARAELALAVLFLRCRAAPLADEHAQPLADAIDPAELFVVRAELGLAEPLVGPFVAAGEIALAVLCELDPVASCEHSLGEPLVLTLERDDVPHLAESAVHWLAEFCVLAPVASVTVVVGQRAGIVVLVSTAAFPAFGDFAER